MTVRARRNASRVAPGRWAGFAERWLAKRWIAAGILLWACGFSQDTAAADGFGPETLPTPEAQAVFHDQVRPLLSEYCYSCHSGDSAEGGLALDAYQDGALLVKDPERWRTIAERLRDGDMPPEGEERPDEARLNGLADWIERQVAAVDRQRLRDPGRVTMRRLNRVEYNNTIRDLIGLDFHPSDDFPADDVGYGFDNNGDVLSLPPLLMEKYLAAARTIAEAAIVTQPQPRLVKNVAAKETVHQGSGRAFGDSAWQFYGTGKLTVELPIVLPDEYRILVTAFGQQAGSEPARMEVFVNSISIGIVNVTAVGSKPETYEVRTHLESGKQALSLAFINDYYDAAGPPGQRDRNLMIETVRVESVSGPGDTYPEAHRRIIPREPAPADEPAAAREILSTFASRAFRRPAQPSEVERLVRLYELARGEGDSFHEGIRLAVEAALVSPQFLFRLELDPPAAHKGAAASGTPPVRALGDYELASRLSYFLWSTMPDDELLAAAAAGRLHEPAQIATQARRMLADRKLRSFVENFTGQWLELRRLSQVVPNRKLFPDFDPALAAAMREETERFFATVVGEDRSVLDFLDADFTFVNERLATLYGIDDVKGDEFRRVQLNRYERGGLLTQASILTLTSQPTRTSPVRRGKFVLENFLGATIPMAPPGVPPLPEGQEAAAAASLRDRIAQHRSKAECASCHARMDPAGLGLENYNAIGVWRLTDGNAPIDAAGTLGGRRFENPAEFRELLRSRPTQFVRCLAGKLLTYALGRGVEDFDRPAVAEIVARTAATDWRFSGLVEAVVMSDPFIKCQVVGATP